MLKSLFACLYYWHLYRQKYYEMIIEDCICTKLRLEIMDKIQHHALKASSALYKSRKKMPMGI